MEVNVWIVSLAWAMVSCACGCACGPAPTRSICSIAPAIDCRTQHQDRVSAVHRRDRIPPSEASKTKHQSSNIKHQTPNSDWQTPNSSWLKDTTLQGGAVEKRRLLSVRRTAVQRSGFRVHLLRTAQNIPRNLHPLIPTRRRLVSTARRSSPAPPASQRPPRGRRRLHNRAPPHHGASAGARELDTVLGGEEHGGGACRLDARHHFGAEGLPLSAVSCHRRLRTILRSPFLHMAPCTRGGREHGTTQHSVCARIWVSCDDANLHNSSARCTPDEVHRKQTTMEGLGWRGRGPAEQSQQPQARASTPARARPQCWHPAAPRPPHRSSIPAPPQTPGRSARTPPSALRSDPPCLSPPPPRPPPRPPHRPPPPQVPSSRFQPGRARG